MATTTTILLRVPKDVPQLTQFDPTLLHDQPFDAAALAPDTNCEIAHALLLHNSSNNTSTTTTTTTTSRIDHCYRMDLLSSFSQQQLLLAGERARDAAQVRQVHPAGLKLQSLPAGFSTSLTS